MNISRSEALDKSPGVFYDAEHDSEGPGTPGSIKQAKKHIFPKKPKIFKKLQKI